MFESELSNRKSDEPWDIDSIKIGFEDLASEMMDVLFLIVNIISVFLYS